MNAPDCGCFLVIVTMKKYRILPFSPETLISGKTEPYSDWSITFKITQSCKNLSYSVSWSELVDFGHYESFVSHLQFMKKQNK